MIVYASLSHGYVNFKARRNCYMLDSNVSEFVTFSLHSTTPNDVHFTKEVPKMGKQTRIFALINSSAINWKQNALQPLSWFSRQHFVREQKCASCVTGELLLKSSSVLLWVRLSNVTCALINISWLHEVASQNHISTYHDSIISLLNLENQFR